MTKAITPHRKFRLWMSFCAAKLSQICHGNSAHEITASASDRAAPHPLCFSLPHLDSSRASPDWPSSTRTDQPIGAEPPSQGFGLARAAWRPLRANALAHLVGNGGNGGNLVNQSEQMSCETSPRRASLRVKFRASPQRATYLSIARS